MKLYHYPNCSSCKKAIKYLNEKEFDVEYLDISLTPPSMAELKQMLVIYGGQLRKLFNTSGMLYRELNLKEKLASMSEAEALKLLSENGMLVKRPFLLANSEQGFLGFKPEEWQALRN